MNRIFIYINETIELWKKRLSHICTYCMYINIYLPHIHHTIIDAPETAPLLERFTWRWNVLYYICHVLLCNRYIHSTFIRSTHAPSVTDTKGPEIRTGTVDPALGGKLKLVKGQFIEVAS